MEKQFDFNTVGKRLPYTVPDGFFDTLEASVMQEVRRRKRKTFAMRAMLAVAAALALVVLLNVGILHDDKTDAAEVEQAFSELTNDDQAFLMAVFQEDVFINSGQE